MEEAQAAKVKEKQAAAARRKSFTRLENMQGTSRQLRCQALLIDV
jgi:hypothetical protein